MSFEALKFTTAGKALQLRALAGESLVFTQIQVGEGNTTPEEIPTLAGLVSLVKAIDIGRCARTDTRYTVEGSFRNDEIPHSFYYRELGVFAADPDYPNDRSKDILYAYQNAYDTAEYISISAGEIIEKIIRVNMFVGEAESVSALIDSSTIFVTRDELETTLAGYATTSDLDSKAPKQHTHTTEDISDFPESLPANGGNAETVNEHTVYSDVPENAVFTDTVYTHPAYTARTGVPTAAQTPAFGGTFTVTQPVSDATGHITAMNSRTVTVPSSVATASANGLMSSTDKSKLDGVEANANNYSHPTTTAITGVPTANQTPAFGGTFTVNQVSRDTLGHVSGITSRTITIPSTAASASAAGLVSTAAQTFAGNKTFNGQIIPAGATAYGTPQARKLSSGTAEANTTNCPSGAWYGRHD